MLQIELQGETICLLPEKAIYWPAQKSIIVADLHWGKTGHFRKHGIAIPVNTQINDEIRLAGIVQQYKAERLIVAGDLFHSVHNNEVESFGHWRDSHPDLQIDLVIGNHDILDRTLYTKWNIKLHQEVLSIAPFTISHDDIDDSAEFILHGHVHPCVKLMQNKHMGIKLSCFCQTANRMLLPAFGDFTGSKQQEIEAHQHIYVITETEVIQWK